MGTELTIDPDMQPLAEMLYGKLDKPVADNPRGVLALAAYAIAVLEGQINRGDMVPEIAGEWDEVDGTVPAENVFPTREITDARKPEWFKRVERLTARIDDIERRLDVAGL